MNFSRSFVWGCIARGKNSFIDQGVYRTGFATRLLHSTTDENFTDADEGHHLKKYNYNSTFEDDEGNPLEPTGMLTYARPLRSNKEHSQYMRRFYFIDKKFVQFRAGNGGDGYIHFLKLFCNDKAGPDGGDGGNGGHIVLRAKSQVKSLANIQSLYHGNHGESGDHKDLFGKCGEHIFIDVPRFTTVTSESGELLTELVDHDSIFVVARGGAGGKGNHFFLSNQNRHPSVAEKGARGEIVRATLEMRCMAHAGLIGFPNVGKSTLLRAISRAKPKIASYAFTTRNPHIGIIEYDDYVQLAVADLPGLVEGAHKNVGMGLKFLKHVEKCVCLFYVIDLSQKNPSTQLEALKYELEKYKPGLARKPHAVIGSKYDSSGLEENLEQLRNHIISTTPSGVKPLEVIPVSAKYGQNLPSFLRHLRDLYDLYNKPDTEDEGLVW